MNKNKFEKKTDLAAGCIPSEKTFWQKIIKQRQLVYMSLPLVIYVFIFKFVPLWGWTMAFQDYKPARHFLQQNWVGFKWFAFLFKDKEFLFALRNTVCMSIISTVLGYFTAILIALLLNEVKHVGLKRIVQTVSYLPHFLSWVIVTGLVSAMFSVEDGTVNNILAALGFIKSPILWLSEPKYFWWIIGWTYVWKEVGWNTIVYLGAMTAIDPSLYEAAEIDGANRMQKMAHITLPGIRSTVIIMMIMSAGHILDANFEMPFFLQNGMIQDVAQTVDLYVLRYGFSSFNYALATAAGIFKNIVNIALLLFANWIAKRSGEERLI
jgi:putative aldouronate transport system permease protein